MEENKKINSFCFLHPDVFDVNSFKNYITSSNRLDNFELIWDDKTPDILFATELIYTSRYYWKQFKKLSQIAKITVFYSIEAYSVDFNLFDIGFTYDDNLNGKRFCQVLPPEDNYTYYVKQFHNELKTKEEARALLKGRKFCNFLYSNWNSHPFRDSLFYILSSYKHIDSHGRHLNNVGKIDRSKNNYAAEITTIKSEYKFSIASENAFCPGYTTEKILTSLVAHTVPIYFGNIDIDKDVNPKCFINCMKCKSEEEIIKLVKQIDEDDDLWCEMVSQPWFTKDQLLVKEERRNNFYDMLKKIFESDLEELQFKSEGTANYNYKDFVYNQDIHYDSVNTIRGLLKKYGIVKIYNRK